jgi:hypothetical protein
MTLNTLVTVNAILAALVVYGLVWLLGFGIHSDRLARASHLRAHVPPPADEHDRLAA